MRVAALNLASGRGTASLGDGLAPLAGCDVLALSEVDDAQPRSGGLDQAAAAAAAVGLPHWRMAPTLAGTTT